MPEEDVETRYYDRQTGKEERRCTEHAPAQGARRRRQNTLRTPILVGMACQGAASERPGWQRYERCSNMITLWPKKTPENAVVSTTRSESRSTLTSSNAVREAHHGLLTPISACRMPSVPHSRDLHQQRYRHMAPYFTRGSTQTGRRA